MTRWCFDLGNTRLKCAALRGDGSLGPVTALVHGAATFSETLIALLPRDAGSAYVASVASTALTVSMIEILASRFSRISLARSTAQCAGVHSAYAQPSTLGVDRFLGMIAARARAPGAWLVAGVGTALTVDLLDRQGIHRGGRIAPSPGTMRRALHHAAPHLPAEGGDYHEFATTTADALASGCDAAALGLIERSLRVGEQLLGEPPALLLHGGGAPALVQHLPQAVHAPSLVLEGLSIWTDLGATPTTSR